MTLRHYLISDDLDDLEKLEEQLEAGGIENPKIHVLSHDEIGVANHMHLHAVKSLFESDVVHSAEVGALVGVVAVTVILGGAYVLDLPDAILGWVPYVFLSFIAFGFCTWEGGLIGFQKRNYHFRQFENVLDQGKHIFLVDLDPEQEQKLSDVLKMHPDVVEVATEPGVPHWLLAVLHWLDGFVDRNLYSRSQQHK